MGTMMPYVTRKDTGGGAVGSKVVMRNWTERQQSEAWRRLLSCDTGEAPNYFFAMAVVTAVEIQARMSP
jgi:hypothetical protein